MRRRLLNLLTASSVLLCVAVYAASVRSRSAHDERGAVIGGDSYIVVSGAGGLSLWKVDDWRVARSAALGVATRRRGMWGFGYVRGWHTLAPEEIPGFATHAGARKPFRIWTAPYWFLFVSSAAPAGLLTTLYLHRRRLARRAARAGLCRACGYDLRATPGRCPECGAAVSVSTSR